jgi:hypothetical protein
MVNRAVPIPGLRHLWVGLVACGAALTLSVTALHAQDRNAPAVAAPKHLTIVGIPSATVAPHGTVFGSLALTNRREGVLRDWDGSAALGFGYGSAEEAIGFQFSATIASMTRTFGDSGHLSIKASRRIAAGAMPTYLGASLDYIAPWGDSRHREPSATLALTSFASVDFGGASPTPLMMTLGAGSHIRNNDSRPGVFGGVGVGLTEHLAASVSVLDDAVDFGMGFRPGNPEGVFFTFALNDALNLRDRRRVTMTATWALSDVFGR